MPYHSDRTYCASWRGCRDGPTCLRALTGSVIVAAERAGMEGMISVEVCPDDCYKPIDKEEERKP